MHGLINKSIQVFVQDNFGRARWVEVAHRAGLENSDFEAMLHYDDALTEDVIGAAAAVFDLPREAILEDLGTFLVSGARVESVRRLLRFGGADFVEFLHSLDELPDRTRLAVGDLELPVLELNEHAEHTYSLRIDSEFSGFGHVLLGVLRAMADDYGALAFLEHRGQVEGAELVDITLIETAFSDGRSFDLGAQAAG